jgi:hypothetical protein
MLSQKTYNEISRLTWVAAYEIPGRDTIDKITAIRGYLRLLESHPNRKDYAGSLSEVLLYLAEIAVSRGRQDLVEQLHSLVTAVDQERMS